MAQTHFTNLLIVVVVAFAAPYSDLLSAPGQRDTALAFFHARRRALVG